MKTLPLVAIVVIITVLAVGIYVGKKEQSLSNNTDTMQNGNTERTLSLVRTSRDNHYIYEGVIALPTPCHRLNAEPTIAESYPEQVTLNLHTIESPNPCAQVITERSFKVEFDASPNHILNARLDGVPIDVVVHDKDNSSTTTLPSEPKDIELAPL